MLIVRVFLPDCNAVCPNGGSPRGDGTQACECFENPPMPTLHPVGLFR